MSGLEKGHPTGRHRRIGLLWNIRQRVTHLVVMVEPGSFPEDPPRRGPSGVGRWGRLVLDDDPSIRVTGHPIPVSSLPWNFFHVFSRSPRRLVLRKTKEILKLVVSPCSVIRIVQSFGYDQIWRGKDKVVVPFGADCNDGEILNVPGLRSFHRKYWCLWWFWGIDKELIF